MPRNGTITLENNFTRGLVTEYTAMNFPENAVTDADNCVFSELNSVTRRLGVDYEESAEVRPLQDVTDYPNTFVEFKWFSVGNNGTVTFVVQQIGDKIIFFSFESSLSISEGLKPFSVDLNNFAVGGASPETISNQTCQFTTGDGYLFVAHPFCDPFYVAYDEVSDDITTAAISIQIRDMAGVDDGLATDTRPTTLSNLHKYNLWNQGWHGIALMANGSNQNPLENWGANRADYPSNSDIFWVFKNAEERFTTARVNQIYLGNTPAPRGHYVYDAFNVDRSALTAIPDLPIRSSGFARPSVIAWYAGRVWYAGVRSPRYATTLYFTQLVEGEREFGKCYQINDPTSEHIFDLLDTDGGTIELPLMESVVTMKTVGDSLIIVGTNAVYAIQGSDNGPFRATNYVVKYISPIGGISHLNFVEAEGALIWWNYDGIYTLVPNQMGTSYEVQNISKQTIQSFIDQIPTSNRLYIKGAYNKRQQIVRWIFTSQGNSLGQYEYDRILDFNIVSKAFYPYTIDITTGPRISGLLTVFGQSFSTVEDDVYVGLNDPVEVSGDQVFVETSVFLGNQEVFKFFTTGDEIAVVPGYTYSELRDEDLVDWATENSGSGVPYDSYCISGYRVRGEMLRAFNSTPIAFVVENLDTGRCLVSGVWDYGFRQSSKHELYLTRPEVSNIIRRVKIRGKGKSLQIKFESVANHPFNLVGWSTFDTGGTQP